MTRLFGVWVGDVVRLSDRAGLETPGARREVAVAQVRTPSFRCNCCRCVRAPRQATRPERNAVLRFLIVAGRGQPGASIRVRLFYFA